MPAALKKREIAAAAQFQLLTHESMSSVLILSQNGRSEAASDNGISDGEAAAAAAAS
jgi:hypothetical protein